MEPYRYYTRDGEPYQELSPHDTAPMPRVEAAAAPSAEAMDEAAYDPQRDYEEFFWGEGTEMPPKRRGGCCSVVLGLLLSLALVGLLLPQAPINYDILRGTNLHHLQTWFSDTFGLQLPGPTQEQLEAIYNQESLAEDGYFKAEPPTSIATVDEAQFYYRRALSEHAASVYDAMLAGLQAHEEEIALPLLTSAKELQAVWSFVLYDHPEIYYLPDTARVTYWEMAGNIVSMQPEYKYDAETVAELDAAYEALALELPLLGETQAQTMENICIYVADSTDYLNSDNDQSIDSVFSAHASVCAGYAKAVQYLALRHGIPCIYIVGTAEDVLNTGGGHAWLAALVDGEVRYYDPTWFDQRGWHADQFLGMNLVEISADHKATYPQLLPR